ncbi:MAG: 3-isopropylmalate dehydratase small subunit [Bacteroidales bacterium]
MDKLSILNSKVVVIENDNIDTDQIIPARFLKATNREGFGDKLFYDWRYDSEGKEITDSPIKQVNPGAKVLLAGNNFGCGSSREHAAWAIHDYGFRVVISSSFADIFRNNALNCGVLPIQIKQEEHKRLMLIFKEDPNADIVVDIENQSINVPNFKFNAVFPISEYKKECFINGFDDIDYLLNIKDYIEIYEKEYSPITW